MSLDKLPIEVRIAALTHVIATTTRYLEDPESRNIRSFLMKLIEVSQAQLEEFIERIKELDELKQNGKKLLVELEKLSEEKQEDDSLLDPRKIKKLLDRHVIGQDIAKKQLAVAAYKHLRRMELAQEGKELPHKSNVILIGNTGTGKTFLVEHLSKIIDVPFVIVDASSITSSGYVGESVNVIAERLVSASKGNLDKAGFGICFLDEVDKLAEASGGDISTTDVQYELLKVIEGAELRGSNNSSNPGYKTIINTKNVLFIAGGAFRGKLDEDKTEDVKGSLVFTECEAQKGRRIPLNEQMLEYGLLPEFVGRFTTGAQLKDLSKEDLVRIMKESESSIIKNMKYLFGADDINLHFTDGALELIAEESLKKQTGARGIVSVIEQVTNDLQFEMLGRNDIKKVKIDRNFIKRKLA